MPIKPFWYPIAAGIPASQREEMSTLQTLYAVLAKLDECISTINNINAIDIEKIVAPKFSSLESYSAGDYVTYDNLLYICLEDQDPGTWNANKWEEVDIGSQLEAANTKLISLKSRLDSVEPDVGQLKLDVNSLGTAVSGLTQRVGTAESNITGLNSAVGGKQAKAIYKTVTIPASGWVNGLQTIAVEGIISDTSKQNIHVSPASADHLTWKESGIWPSAQTTNAITFTCDEEAPGVNVTAVLEIWNLE